MNFLEICGSISLAYIAFVCLKPLFGFICNQLFKACSKDPLKPSTNDYAIITGSTDGIGLEYARRLAQKGYNLLLLSRTEEKLTKVANEIKNDFSQCQNVEYLAVDFSRSDIYEKITEKVDKLDGAVAVLVNNVGLTHNIPEYFTKFPENLNKNMVMANVLSTTMMSEIVLKLMVNQKRGIVINISSLVGCCEFPMFASYSASKAYMNSLSSCLSTEYKQHGIIIQTVTPNQVQTKLSKDLHEASISITAKQFVEHALKTVGSERHTHGHIKHKFVNKLTLLIRLILGYDLFMRLMYFVGKKTRNTYLSKQ